jgi:hypothetical protein
MDTQGELQLESNVTMLNWWVLIIEYPIISFLPNAPHIIIVISVAKGTPNALLMCFVALFGFNQVGTMAPICKQQLFAKDHLRNKCWSVSSFCLKHSSQLYESNCICLLLSIAPVFSLFCNSNQKKLSIMILCFVDSISTCMQNWASCWKSLFKFKSQI